MVTPIPISGNLSSLNQPNRTAGPTYLDPRARAFANTEHGIAEALRIAKNKTNAADVIAESILSQQNDLETAMAENLNVSAQSAGLSDWMSGMGATDPGAAAKAAFAVAGAPVAPQGMKAQQYVYPAVEKSPEQIAEEQALLRALESYKANPDAFRGLGAAGQSTVPTATTNITNNYQDEYLAGRGDFATNYEAALTLDPDAARQFLNTQLDSLMPADQGGSMSQAFIDDYFDYTGIDLLQGQEEINPVKVLQESIRIRSAQTGEEDKIDARLKALDDLLANNPDLNNDAGYKAIADFLLNFKPPAGTETGTKTETGTETGKTDKTGKTGETGTETGVTGEKVNVEEGIEGIFGGLSASGLENEIRSRMEGLGTADLSTYIQQQLGTVTTPDYSSDITQRYGEMGDALDTVASERRRILGESAGRARTEIDRIQQNLGTELRGLEEGRVEQQTALEQKVIDRTTEFEQALTERLTDIRADLGEQVTSEFEEVAALAETLTASQATSSRDAMSRLTAIGDMAAAARMSAPAELSAEALTALNDLEFQVTNQIAQSLAEGQAEIDIDMANALLGETMRQGDFATQQSAILANAMIDEKLRGTTYADQIDMIQAEALMADDRYVRDFDDQVSMQMAQAQLQNLFGTQDYQRQLDMLNLQRGWETADTLQQRGWDVADMLQQRGWQTADTLEARGWQTADIDQQRLWDLEDALLEDQEAPMGIVEKLREQFPKAPEQLMITASSIAGMDWEPIMDNPTTDEKEYLKYRDQLLKDADGNVILDANGQPTSTDPEYEGANASFYMAGPKENPAEQYPVYFLQKQLAPSPADIYLRTLTGQLTEDEKEEIRDKGGDPDIKTLNVTDSATLRALVDALRAMSAQDLATILAERPVKLTEIPTGGTPVTGTGNLEGLLSQVITSPALESDWWREVQEKMKMLGRTG